MKSRLRAALTAVLLVSVGCKLPGQDGSSSSYTFGGGPAVEMARQAQIYSKFSAVTGAADGFFKRSSSLVAIASNNFANVLATTPPTGAAVAAYDDALKGLAGDYMKVMRAVHDVAAPVVPVTQPLVTSALPDGLEVSRKPFLFAVAAIAVPFAVAGYRHLRNIYDARAEPVVQRIMGASDEELQLIKATLNLPTAYNRVQTLDHFQNKIGFSERANRAKEIEAALTLNADGLANVRPFGQEVNQAVAKSATEAGKAAVDLVVSAANNATGGSGLKEIGQAAGLGAKAAEAVDVTISAVQTTTGESLAPLDLLSSHMQASVSGGDPLDVTLPPAAGTTPAQAEAILAEADSSVERLGQATAVLTDDLLTKTGGGGSSIKQVDMPDGSSVVTVPSRTHIVTADDVKNTSTLQVLNLGRADVVIAAQGHRVQSPGDVTVTAGTVVKYRVDPPPAASAPNPTLLCTLGDYAGAFAIYKMDRSDGDAFIVTATCAFGFYDYGSAVSLALQGAGVSSKGGRAHNYFIAEYAAERMGASGESYGASGLAAAKQSGQCEGVGNPDLCAALYQSSIRDGLDTYQMGLLK